MFLGLCDTCHVITPIYDVSTTKKRPSPPSPPSNKEVDIFYDKLGSSIQIFREYKDFIFRIF